MGRRVFVFSRKRIPLAFQSAEVRGYFWSKYSVRHRRNKSIASPNNAGWQIPKGFTRHFTRLCKNSPGASTQPRLSIDRAVVWNSSRGFDFPPVAPPNITRRIARLFLAPRLTRSRIFAIRHRRPPFLLRRPASARYLRNSLAADGPVAKI